MEFERSRELLLLWCRIRITRVALVGGNHTASRETVMELAPGSGRAKNKNMSKHVHGERMGLNSNTLLVIKLPDPKVLRVISRSVFLAVIFITFPCIGSIMRWSSADSGSSFETGAIDFEQLDVLLRDLVDEGLLLKNNKALVVSPIVPSTVHKLKNFDANQMDMVMDTALEGQSSFSEELFDFVYASNLAVDVEFVDHIVKIGGILAFPLSNEKAITLRDMTNYKIAYLRRYSSTIVAMRKIGSTEASSASNYSPKRRLLGLATEAKKAAALEDLEEALLEPPRWPIKNLKNYSRKIKFLPHLMGNSLDGFRRRVFVNVGLPEDKRDVNQWFHQDYPKMEQEFEVYNLDLEPEEGAISSGVIFQENDVPDWLKINVREEEYVVMKAEAGVVEEMVKRKTMHLVDELFLECNNQWWKGENKSKRAYWECLDLYGRVKDEGVAVHQWWG
ncbi:hypothetical protein G4B88_030512 [Cannabis sativa]|uniref:DUF7870 domain-containing protein n=2 Tax=Cannabis sativa TaxID=3483 RepID=A0A7J6FJA0_CANSA|nr:hypothetical protein G4B88_030512 [Cannabis sativa]